MVERLFLRVPWGYLRFVIVVFPDHTHYFLYLLYTQGFSKKIYYPIESGAGVNNLGEIKALGKNGNLTCQIKLEIRKKCTASL